MAYQKTTIIGTSPDSFTAAADDAIDQAQARFDEVKWAEVTLRGVEVARAEPRDYQVEATVAYEIN